MKKPAVLLAFLLAGCAHDNYTGGDPATMQTSLRACKDQALHDYFQAQSPLGGIVGGLLGGAAGGAIVGAGTSGADRIDPEIESCMAARGYAGTSEN